MAKRVNPELTLALDGEVTAQALASALKAFVDLLDAVSEEEAADVPLEWVVTNLSPGSSVITAECRVIDTNDYLHAQRVVDAAQRFGADMQSRNGHSTSPRLKALRKEFEAIPDKKRLLRVRLETPEQDFVLSGIPVPRQARGVGPLKSAFGSVRGRVQAMNSHGSLRFTLYDFVEDRGVSCYIDEGIDSEKFLLELWGQSVEVEGRVLRDATTGRAISVREIGHVRRLDELAWRDAIGAVKGFLGDERSEDIVRRMRDA